MHERDACGNHEECEPGTRARGAQFGRNVVGAGSETETEGDDAASGQARNVVAHARAVSDERDARGEKEFPALQVRCRVIQL